MAAALAGHLARGGNKWVIFTYFPGWSSPPFGRSRRGQHRAGRRFDSAEASWQSTMGQAIVRVRAEFDSYFLRPAVWQLGDPRGDHRPLAFRQVSPGQVGGEDEGRRIIAVLFDVFRHAGQVGGVPSPKGSGRRRPFDKFRVCDTSTAASSGEDFGVGMRVHDDDEL
jgi:hypothetical protein